MRNRGRRWRGGHSTRSALSRGDPRKFRASGLALWLRSDLGITLGDTPRASGTTPPAITLTGTLTLARGLYIKIDGAGARGAATFRWSLDDGVTFQQSAVLTAATVPLAGDAAAITVNFPAGTYAVDNIYRAIVAQWSDQSGNNFHVLQGTAALQPQYNQTESFLGGRGGLFFTRAANTSLANASDALVATSSARTTFAVFKVTPAAESGGVVDYIRAATARSIHRFYSTGGTCFVMTDGVTMNETIPNPADFNTVGHYATWNQPVPGSAITFELDGTNRTVSGPNVPAEVAGSGFTIGNLFGSAVDAFEGSISEVIVYRQAFYAGAAARVKSYEKIRYRL